MIYRITSLFDESAYNSLLIVSFVYHGFISDAEAFCNYWFKVEICQPRVRTIFSFCGFQKMTKKKRQDDMSFYAFCHQNSRKLENAF